MPPKPASLRGVNPAPRTRSSTRLQPSVNEETTRRAGGRGGSGGHGTGSRGSTSNGRGKCRAEAAAEPAVRTHDSPSTVSLQDASPDFEVDTTPQDEEADAPSGLLESGEHLSLSSDLRRDLPSGTSDKDAIIAALMKRLRDQEQQANALKRSAEAEPVDLLANHQAKRSRTDRALPSSASLRSKLAQQQSLGGLATNAVPGQVPVSRPPAVALLLKASNSAYASPSSINVSHPTPSPHPLSRTPTPGLSKNSSRPRGLILPPFLSSCSQPLPSPSLSSGASTTPPPVPVTATVAEPQPVVQPGQAPQPTPSGLINPAKPNAIASYDVEHQSVLNHAKNYLHLWLVIDDAFPTAMKREAIIKSSLETANSDFVEIAMVVITDPIKKMLRDHISRTRNKWKAHAQTIVPTAYGLEVRNGAEANKTRAEWLLENHRWVYGAIRPAVGQGQKEKRMHPFAHPAIKQVIIASAFENKHSVARLRPDKLQPVPLPMLAFAALVLKNALDEFTRTGIRTNVDMEAKTYTQPYHNLMENVLQYDQRKTEQSLELRMDIWKQGSALIDHPFRAINEQPEQEFVIDDTDSEEEGVMPVQEQQGEDNLELDFAERGGILQNCGRSRVGDQSEQDNGDDESEYMFEEDGYVTSYGAGEEDGGLDPPFALSS